MSEFGQKLIESMKSAVEIAQGKADPSTYRVHVINVETVDINNHAAELGTGKM